MDRTWTDDRYRNERSPAPAKSDGDGGPECNRKWPDNGLFLDGSGGVLKFARSAFNAQEDQRTAVMTRARELAFRRLLLCYCMVAEDQGRSTRCSAQRNNAAAIRTARRYSRNVTGAAMPG
jgi:hypothetical protein